MNRIIVFLLCFFVCYSAISQPISYRASDVITVSDGRLQAQYNLFIPRYTDTTAANLKKGIDSCGALIYTYEGNKVWKRSCNPKRWEEVGSSGGSGTVTSISQAYGISNTPNTITTTGTIKVDTTIGGLSGKYLRIVDTTNKWVQSVTKVNDSTIRVTKNGIGTNIVLRGAVDTPTLQMVLNKGNLSYQKSILIVDSVNTGSSANVVAVLSSSDSIRGLVGPPFVGLEKRFTSNYATLQFDKTTYPGKLLPVIYLSSSDLGNEFRARSDRMFFKNLTSGNTIYLTPPNTITNDTIKLPNTTGTLIAKINGNSPDSTGNINLSYVDSLKRNAGTDSVFARKNGQWVFQYKDSIGGGSGSTPSLQQVTDVDSVTTNNIYVNQINYYDSVVAPQHTVKQFARDGGFYVYSNFSNSNMFYVDYASGFATYNSDSGSVANFVNVNVNGIKDYYLPDTSGTLALKEYTIDSLKRNPGTDSVFAQKNGQWVFQYRDSVGVSGGGGGGGKIYYFNGGVSMGTFGGIPMYELGDTAVIGTAANFTKATTGNIANFITDVGKPGLLQIPAGVWTIDAYLSETGGGSNHAEIYAILEVWNGSTLTTIATSSIEEITNGSVIDLYTFSISVPITTISTTDRIVIQFYIQNTNGKTVTLYTQNGYVGEVHTTFTTGIGALNGLTAPSQTFVVGTSGTDFNVSSATSTHTFNLPTASATNRGALSATDWSTFNGKIGASDTSVFQRKSMAAFTFKANNTSSTANATDQVFKDSGTLTYSGTITWTGTTAPSGATSHRYRWCQIGKQVTITISLNYASSGAALTAVKLTLPAGCPSPTNFGTLTGANDIIGSAWAFLGTSTSAATTGRVTLNNNASNNGFEFNISAASGGYRAAGFTLTYFTD